MMTTIPYAAYFRSGLPPEAPESEVSPVPVESWLADSIVVWTGKLWSSRFPKVFLKLRESVIVAAVPAAVEFLPKNVPLNPAGNEKLPPSPGNAPDLDLLNVVVAELLALPWLDRRGAVNGIVTLNGSGVLGSISPR